MVIEQAAVKQIISEHGPNGTIDRSMADMSDITRIQYVIDHYDAIRSGGTTTVYSTGAARQANVVLFEKAVNGTNYVVEAALSLFSEYDGCHGKLLERKTRNPCD